MIWPPGEWKTPYFVVSYGDTKGFSLWVEEIDADHDGGGLLIPNDGLDELIAALQAARTARPIDAIVVEGAVHE